MSLVTIKLPQRDAEACARGEASALRRAQSAIAAALQQLARRVARKGARRRALALPAPAPKKSAGWPSLKLRRAVYDRSEGRCENPRCGRRIRWHSFDMDHVVGRANAPQIPENTWAICNGRAEPGDPSGCHGRKTDNVPDAIYWLEAFLEFARRRFAGSETVAVVGAQLQAERAAAELDRRRKSADGGPPWPF
jgi:hypothetical protein